jgi:hypothetical protein
VVLRSCGGVSGAGSSQHGDAFQPPLWRCMAWATGIEQLLCMAQLLQVLAERAGGTPISGTLRHFGSTSGRPPGAPGGGMILMSPPCGGVTCMLGSTPAGGQMTPLDWSSFSLRSGVEGPPTVGGAPFTSGGQVTAGGTGRRLSLDCARAPPMETTLAKNPMMSVACRKELPRRNRPQACKPTTPTRRWRRCSCRNLSAAIFTAARGGKRGVGGRGRRPYCGLSLRRSTDAVDTVSKAVPLAA